jgi:cytochrome P450
VREVHAMSKTAPGPAGLPLVGVLPWAWHRPLEFLPEIRRRYGEVVGLRFGRYQAYLVSAPDLIRHIVQENHRNYVKGLDTQKLKVLVGEGLLTSEGDLWRQQRRLAQPAFQRKRLEGFGAVMAEAARAMLDRWAPRAARGEAVDVAAEARRLALEIAARTLFHADLGADADAIAEATTVAQGEINARAWLPVDLPEWLPLPANRRLRRAIATLDRIVRRIIEARRRSGADTGDLLSLLLHARDEETGRAMSDAQVRDEVVTLLLAGHETTANALAWAWWSLGRDAEAARRLDAEVAAVLGGRTPRFDDLARLPYTHMAVEETLRLFPPAWGISRTPIAADEVGGFRIDAGSIVIMSQWVVHRDPALWADPERFRPERFAPAEVAARPRFAYFPFGGGPRVCIGSSFALAELVLVLAMAAQRYWIRLVPGQRVEPEALITLRPRGEILVTLERRPAPEAAAAAAARGAPAGT